MDRGSAHMWFMKRMFAHGLTALAIGLLPVVNSADVRADNVFNAPFDPAYCGARLNRVYDGDFSQFWNFLQQQGFAAVPEFTWSVDNLPGETPEDWRGRALQCVLEIERANLSDEALVTRYSTGFMLWFGTPSVGFDREFDGGPGVRQRAYTMLLDAARDGSREASAALVQVYVEMVRVADRRRAYGSKAGSAPEIPDWFPSTDQILSDLDQQAKSGQMPSAYLAIATIYDDRAQLAELAGHDHEGRAVSGPDPRLIAAAQAYRKAWRDLNAQASAS